MYYLQLDGFSIVGSSPEILVRLRDGTVTIRPIAGTRKRGATPEEDRALEDDLLSDPNEWTNLIEKHRDLVGPFKAWLPIRYAEEVPTKGAYDFDPSNYTWRKR